MKKLISFVLSWFFIIMSDFANSLYVTAKRLNLSLYTLYNLGWRFWQLSHKVQDWGGRGAWIKDFDKGPWEVSQDGFRIYSKDFERDVTITISGDFSSSEHKAEYAKWVASALNDRSHKR